MISTLWMVGLLLASPARGQVELDGSLTQVTWTDGDSFRVTSGHHDGRQARLQGFNTLESFGPVHQWGNWTAYELYDLAKKAKEQANAAGKTWKCSVEGKPDHYGRILVRCPELITHMVESGLAHVFEVEKAPSPEALAAQKAAIAAKRGMWAKGVPKGVLTSLHSVGEDQLPTAYNRVADLETGMATKLEHQETYTACQQVCHAGSCLMYIPFDERYGDHRAPCLRTGKPTKPAPNAPDAAPAP